MVGRQPAYHRGFPLHLGGRVAQRGSVAGGVPRAMLVDGKPPRFEIVDPLTVRYSWDGPNPDFLPSARGAAAAEPGAACRTIMQAVSQEVPGRGQAQGADEGEQGQEVDGAPHPHGPPVPAGEPGSADARPLAQHAPSRRPSSSSSSATPISTESTRTASSCPISTSFMLNVSSSSIIPAKTGAGETDLQATGIDFTDYTFLKDAEKRYPVKVSLWKRTQGSRLALLPNLNYRRRGLAAALARRALAAGAVAGDRPRARSTWPSSTGSATASADTVLPESPLFQAGVRQGLDRHSIPTRPMRCSTRSASTERDDDGIRLLPDGRTAQIMVETAGESTLETDVLELVTDHWRKVGIALFIRTSQRDVFRSRAIGGQIMMSMWSGIDNGVPTADMNPGELAPTVERPAAMAALGFLLLNRTARRVSRPTCPRRLAGRAAQDVAGVGGRGRPDRARSGTEMLALYTDQVFSIGIVNGTLQPVLATARLQNMPDDGALRLRPTSYFGVYMPIPSGWTRRPERAALHPLAHRRDGPDAADHLGAGLHHHRAAARRLFRKLYRRAQGAGRRRRHGPDRGAARANTASTSRR